MYAVYFTQEFSSHLKKLDNSVRKKIEKEITSIQKNPWSGKPLSFAFLREKKFGKFRIYYMIYKEEVIVLFVGLSDKKTQQKKINILKERLKSFRDLIKKKINFFQEPKA